MQRGEVEGAAERALHLPDAADPHGFDKHRLCSSLV